MGLPLAGAAPTRCAASGSTTFSPTCTHARITDEDRAAMSTDVLYDEETGLPV
jgi:hypothetical protein